MMVFLLLYSSNFPHMTPNGFVCKKIQCLRLLVLLTNAKVRFNSTLIIYTLLFCACIQCSFIVQSMHVTSYIHSIIIKMSGHNDNIIY